MANGLSFADWKKKLAGLIPGGQAGSAAEAETDAGRVAQRQTVYEFVMPTGATASLSLPLAQAGSQPIRERTVFIAHNRCEVKAVYFAQLLSSTVTATETMAWHLLVQKKGGSVDTVSTSNTYSVTTYIAGLSSGTDKAGTHTNSWSSLTSNTANYPNPCHLNKTSGTLQLGPGDILTAQVLKGSGTGNDSGAVFRGGQLIIVTEDN